jgi:hypothetical protein
MQPANGSNPIGITSSSRIGAITIGQTTAGQSMARNMGLTQPPRRRGERDDQQINWVTLLVMTALVFVILAELRVIVKYIWG